MFKKIMMAALIRGEHVLRNSTSEGSGPPGAGPHSLDCITITFLKAHTDMPLQKKLPSFQTGVGHCL